MTHLWSRKKSWRSATNGVCCMCITYAIGKKYNQTTLVFIENFEPSDYRSWVRLPEDFDLLRRIGNCSIDINKSCLRCCVIGNNSYLLGNVYKNVAPTQVCDMSTLMVDRLNRKVEASQIDLSHFWRRGPFDAIFEASVHKTMKSIGSRWFWCVKYFELFFSI